MILSLKVTIAPIVDPGNLVPKSKLKEAIR